MAAILESERVGVALRDFGEADMLAAIAYLVKLAREPGIHQRCRQAAQIHFSLESGVQQYSRIYGELLTEGEP